MSDDASAAQALMPTELLKDTWVAQDKMYPENWWLEKYWNSTEGSHRDAIIRALEHVGAESGGDHLQHESDGVFTSLLELGCNTGPNLRRIHQRWPSVSLAGLDVHRGALEYGVAAAAREGWGWTGIVGDVRKLDQLGECDVVLSCYALAYLDPRDIDQALRAALACARVALILCEPGEGAQDAYAPPGPANVAEYHYHFRERLAGLLGPHSTLLETPITPHHQRLTRILTVRK